MCLVQQLTRLTLPVTLQNSATTIAISEMGKVKQNEVHYSGRYAEGQVGVGIDLGFKPRGLENQQHQPV